MHALTDFLTTDYGLLSAGTILFIIGMASHFVWYVRKHIREDTAKYEAGLKLKAQCDESARPSSGA